MFDAEPFLEVLRYLPSVENGFVVFAVFCHQISRLVVAVLCCAATIRVLLFAFVIVATAAAAAAASGFAFASGVNATGGGPKQTLVRSATDFLVEIQIIPSKGCWRRVIVFAIILSATEIAFAISVGHVFRDKASCHGTFVVPIV